MSDTKKQYAQIEKEALALTLAAEKFAMHLLGGKLFCMETDHKPLVRLLSTKNWDHLPPHVLRFRLRGTTFQLFTDKESFRCSIQITIATVRWSVWSAGPMEAFIANVMSVLQVTPDTLVLIRTAQKQDCHIFAKRAGQTKSPMAPYSRILACQK